MKIENLQVGDWVSANVAIYAHSEYPENIPMQVAELQKGNRLVGLTTPTGSLLLLPEERILPVNITTKILTDSGFKQSSCYYNFEVDEFNRLEYYPFEQRLTLYWSGVDEWQNHERVTNIVGRAFLAEVHELQHAVRLWKLPDLPLDIYKQWTKETLDKAGIKEGEIMFDNESKHV